MSIIQRKLSLLIGACLVIMAFTAAPASAEQEVIVNGEGGNPCEEVSLEGDTVSGGCWAEGWQGSMTLMSGPTVFDKCSSAFAMVIGPEGDFFAVRDPEAPGASNMLTSCYWPRKACEDEATGDDLPWPGAYHVEGVELRAELEVCIEHSGGSYHTWVPVEFETALDGNSSPVGLNGINPEPSSGGWLQDVDFSRGGDEVSIYW